MGYIEPVEFSALGLLAVAFVSLSSPDDVERKLGYETLGEFKNVFEMCQKRKVASWAIDWDPEITDYLTQALSISEQFEFLAEYLEQALPGCSEAKHKPHLPSLCKSGKTLFDLNL